LLGVSGARSGLLAAWTNAFVSGRVSLDQAIDAVTGVDARHQVTALPGFVHDVVTLRELLVAWRRGGAPVRVVLPVPGDVRGLPNAPGLPAAALDAGEAAIGGGIVVVPTVTDYAPSSAPTQVVWQAFPVVPAPAEFESVVDAQYDLTTAIRDTATALAAADVTARKVPAALGDARRAGERLDLPPGHPPRAVALLAQAERMQAVLDLALADPSGGAVDRFAMSAREAALRPLAVAVRRARVTAYNALPG
jgi:hypothetical protein